MNIQAFNKKLIPIFMAMTFLYGCSASSGVRIEEETGTKSNGDEVALPEYLVVTYQGQQYSWFSQYEARVKYIDRHMPFIDNATRSEYLSRVPDVAFNAINGELPDVSFKAINGDVGVLVDDYSDEEGKYVIDISGNLVLIHKDGVERSSRSEYEAFERKLNRKTIPSFGFRLGETTPQQALGMLEDSSRYFMKYDYLKNKDLPAYLVFGYDGAPKINGISPDEMFLRFVDNTLFKITFYWGNNYDNEGTMNSDFSNQVVWPANKSLDDAFGKRSVMSGYINNRRFRTKVRWINSQYSIHEALYYAPNDEISYPSGFYLSYVHNELFREAKNIEERMK